MDDDIDIEEHDVLENPVIKSIFPDLSVIKQEISLFDDQALPLSEVDEESKNILHDEDLKCDSSQSINSDDVIFVADIKCDDECQTSTQLPVAEQTPLFFKNKIILGSRPVQQLIFQKQHEENEENLKLNSAKVYLSDIGTYLENSGKFCKICFILFANTLDLETHDKFIHKKRDCNAIKIKSPVQPVTSSRYKCVKCGIYFTCSSNLRRHMKNIHSEILAYKHKRKTVGNKTESSKSKVSSTSKCFHCKKLFPSQQSLINHIYNVLQSSTVSPQTHQKLMEKKKKIKNTYTTRRKLMLEKRKIERSNEKKEVITTSVEQDDAIYVYRCYYCSYYSENTETYHSHLAMKHKDYDVIFPKTVLFDPYCKFCSVKQDNVRKYNCHLNFRHTEMVNRTFKIETQISLTKIEFILAMKQRRVFQNTKSKGRPQEKIQSNQDCMSETTSDKVNENKAKLKNNDKCMSKTTSDEVKENKETKRKDINKTYIAKKKIKVNVDSGNDYENDIDIDCEQNEDLVLKGILFRCKRCDIHFLTSRSAMDHSEHMELLINWKCQTCLKIFKKQDELLHKKQHSYSDEFVVYELSEAKLSRVLYKCPKCAIHFNDVYYAKHFKFCGKIVTESSYCQACDILLEQSIRSSHDYEHETNNQSLADFTIVTSDIIINTNVAKQIDDKTITTLHNKTKPREFEVITGDSLKMSYCDTCKCFITHSSYLRTVHKDGRCKHMIKHVCKYCGLIMTNQSLQCHRKRHIDDKDLKLQDFKFYDIKTNKRILPPIPEYPKCKFCEVHFISKVAVMNHVCNEIEFLTCPICDIKLSNETFNLHLSFHHYDKKSFNSALINKSESLPTKVKQIPHKKADDKMDDSMSFDASEQPPTDDEVIQATQSEQVPLVEPKNQSEKDRESSNLSSAKIDNKVNKKDTSINSQIEEKTDFELWNVVYCCSYCYMTLLNFDQAVEHCQNHYAEVDINKRMLTCTECKMKYDQKNCYDHKKIHDSQRLQKRFKILNFDAVYFAVDYKLWIEKLFENVATNITQSIMNRSIYKEEGRIKLSVIQKGVSAVTVYQCKACAMFVDPTAIYTHTENSCYKLRKHICTFCGIPFVSHVFRMAHEKVHNNTKELTVNLFKIIIFNRDRDRKYNMDIIKSCKKFIMFQCRICKGIFERFQCRNHECNKFDLKKCPICDFLILNAGFKSHMMKHALIKSFIYSNIEIIRFGKNDNIKSESSSLPLKYDGIVKDYTFYKCLRCNVYIKKSKLVKMEHDCLDNNAKIVCSICDLNFLKKQIIQHNKMHDSDPYFVKDNFNFLTMRERGSSSKTPKEVGSKVDNAITIEENVSLVKVNLEKSLNTKQEKTLVNEIPVVMRITKIYKCDCNLCFLNINSIQSHFGNCHYKITRQTCTKCSLVFTPKDLFNHLLKHHGDKKYLYKFDIIPMNDRKYKIVELYNCSICNIHFLERENVKQHFDKCLNSVNEENKCEKCQLYFKEADLEFHKNNHHDDNVADFDIIDVTEEPNNVTEGNRFLEKDMENIASQADAVIDRNYKFSEEGLSQLSLNSYSNTIYKCIECKIHFLTENTFERHLRNGGNGDHVTFSSPQKDCEICGLNFSLPSLAKHVYIHHNQMKLELSQINIKSTLVDSDERLTN